MIFYYDKTIIGRSDLATHRMRVAVVGTAGRAKDFESHLTQDLFEDMVRVVADKVMPDTVLVSGGAAWADHVAVTLFLRGKVSGLELHMPCEWDAKRTQFVDTGALHWAANPGRTANAYHRSFSKAIGRSSLSEIASAQEKGAVLTTHDGFHARNTVIARECDRAVCPTWASGDAPTGGGSLDTWRKCTKPKEHLSFLTLIEAKPDRPSKKPSLATLDAFLK